MTSLAVELNRFTDDPDGLFEFGSLRKTEENREREKGFLGFLIWVR